MLLRRRRRQRRARGRWARRHDTSPSLPDGATSHWPEVREWRGYVCQIRGRRRWNCADHDDERHPGYTVEEVYGEVFGLTVRSRNIGSQMGAGLKSILGGELKGMTKALGDSRLRDRANGRGGEAKGANAVVAMRFDTSEMGGRGRRSALTGRRCAPRRSDGSGAARIMDRVVWVRSFGARARFVAAVGAAGSGRSCAGRDGDRAGARVRICIGRPRRRLAGGGRVGGLGLGHLAKLRLPGLRSVVVTGSLHATATTKTGATSHSAASSAASNVSIFEGEFTADSISTGSSAVARKQNAGGGVQGNERRQPPGTRPRACLRARQARRLGTLLISRHAVERTSEDGVKGYTGTAIAVESRLTAPHGGLPAGRRSSSVTRSRARKPHRRCPQDRPASRRPRRGAGRRRSGRPRQPLLLRRRACRENGGRLDRAALRSESDVRPPLVAGARRALDRADDHAACDDDAEVGALPVALSSWTQRAVGRGTRDETRARGRDGAARSRSAQRTTSVPQLPKRGFTHDGKPHLRERSTGRQQPGAGMRKPGAKQEPGGQKLVVGGEQRAGPIERADAAGRERAECPEAVLDTVERRKHVEPAERGVAVPELGPLPDRVQGGRSALRAARRRRARDSFRWCAG